MDGPVILAEDVSKTYRLYRTPGDRLRELLWSRQWSDRVEVHALRDISFDVPKGTVFGVIGPNGSGKSTLLSIIAGVLRPTSGTLHVRGSVASLLELGTGFNPELSGRENVRLFGAISGVSPREVERRMGRVLSFAEIGEFADRPVKLYSSGMFVRLAFAAAIHVDPDVLLVDEALAVGDLQFRHKCMHRIHEIRRQGVTIVYVSHEIESVRALADRTLLLHRGQMLDLGDTERVCNRYYELVSELELGAHSASHVERSEWEPVTHSPSEQFFEDPALSRQIEGTRYGSGEVLIRGVQLLDEHGRPCQVARFNERVTIRISVECLADFPWEGMVGMTIRDRNGVTLTGANTHVAGVAFGPRCAGERIVVDFNMRFPFQGFSYSVTPSVSRDPHRPLYTDRIENALVFQVGPPPPPLTLHWPVYLNPDVWVSPPPRVGPMDGRRTDGRNAEPEVGSASATGPTFPR